MACEINKDKNSSPTNSNEFSHEDQESKCKEGESKYGESYRKDDETESNSNHYESASKEDDETTSKDKELTSKEYDKTTSKDEESAFKDNESTLKDDGKDNELNTKEVYDNKYRQSRFSILSRLKNPVKFPKRKQKTIFTTEPALTLSNDELIEMQELKDFLIELPKPASEEILDKCNIDSLKSKSESTSPTISNRRPLPPIPSSKGHHKASSLDHVSEKIEISSSPTAPPKPPRKRQEVCQ